MAEALLANVLTFARALRASGAAIPSGAVGDAVTALHLVGVRRRRDVRDALRTTLIRRHEDFVRFDAWFARFWREWPERDDSRPQPLHVPGRTNVRMLAPGAISPSAPERAPSAEGHPVGVSTYSPNEVWRRKDFSLFSEADVARAMRALATLRWTPGERITRRWIGGRGAHIDFRRVLQANAGKSSELLTLPRRRRRVVPRPLILLCDVSGSMEPYARMLLLFAHALAGRERRVEVFVFSTRLTRVTRHFKDPRVMVAMSGVRDAVKDWSGGTRIGAALRAFNVGWARRMMRGGPVTLLISDGWDLGEPDLLAREVARLQRSTFRLIWLNPLIGSPGYEPLARGMRAARPFVDDFLPVHNMASLESLAAHLNNLVTGSSGHRVKSSVPMTK